MESSAISKGSASQACQAISRKLCIALGQASLMRTKPCSLLDVGSPEQLQELPAAFQYAVMGSFAPTAECILGLYSELQRQWPGKVFSNGDVYQATAN